MKKQDARKLSHDKLTELRLRAVAAIQNGEGTVAEQLVQAAVAAIKKAGGFGAGQNFHAAGW